MTKLSSRCTFRKLCSPQISSSTTNIWKRQRSFLSRKACSSRWWLGKRVSQKQIKRRFKRFYKWKKLKERLRERIRRLLHPWLLLLSSKNWKKVLLRRLLRLQLLKTSTRIVGFLPTFSSKCKHRVASRASCTGAWTYRTSRVWARVMGTCSLRMVKSRALTTRRGTRSKKLMI